ncbi:MAG TPA: cyclic nucleotide-binding domain-containing protein [Mariprofundaceae bacterium]|nr:cyclic nucleotide-binding domain-containing protein [Mariprofundaceae bacterium]
MDIDIPWFEENVLLHKLRADERQLLQEVFEVREYAAGDEIVTQGATAGGIHILYSGTAAITCRMPEMTVYLDEAGEGALFGEMTFLSGGDATATVTAHSHCVVYRMGRHGYYQLIVRNKEMLICLFTYMLSRTAESIQHMNRQQMRILRHRTKTA